jgi:spoIIIJ-associated protein
MREEEELEPMNSYERKLVHDAVSQVDGVETESRGVDPERYVVLRRA